MYNFRVFSLSLLQLQYFLNILSFGFSKFNSFSCYDTSTKMNVTQCSLPHQAKDDQPLKNNLEIIWARNTMIWKHWRLAGSINHYQLCSFSLLSPSPLLQRYRTHSILSKHYSSIITTQNGRMWKNKKHN